MTEPTTSTRKRPLAFHAERALMRYIGHELREFNKALVEGRPSQLPEIEQALHAKFVQLRANSERHGRMTTVEHVQAVVPASVATPAIPRLSAEVVGQILDLRRTGESKRAIGRRLGKPASTIQNVLEREGDPAPRELILKEASTKQKVIERLQAQLAALKSSEIPTAPVAPQTANQVES